MKYLITIGFLMVVMCFTYAQKEANIWYFGGDYPSGVAGNAGGIDFNGVTPVALTDGKLRVQEGCASIADPNTGQLLFYTNGNIIWDANHDTMANGTGILGGATTSSTQVAIIIPQPGNDSLYYVFTTDETINSLSNGFRYTVVNRNLNGGMGDVVLSEKNILLHPTVCEKVTAVRHCNGEDIWVITHEWNSDAFLAYLLSSAGIVDTVISNIGRTPSGGAGGYGDAIGSLVAAPDGSKIACLNRDMSPFQIELFDFCPATGVLSSFIPINISFKSYGLAFSSSSKILYTCGFGTLRQFDLTASNIQASEVNWASSGAALQLAPDKKIYVSQSGSNYLGIIDYPDSLGVACDYQQDAFYLGAGNISWNGLPGFVQSYFKPLPAIEFLGQCIEDTFFFNTNVGYGCNWGLSWNFDDPASGTANTDTTANPFHIFSAPGSYMVSLISGINGMGCKLDTIYQLIVIDSVDISLDTVICLGESVQLSVSGGSIYQWSPGYSLSDSTVANPIATPDTTTEYQVVSFTSCGTDTQRIIVSVLSPSSIPGLPDTIFLAKDSTFYLNTLPAGSYDWLPVAGLSCNTCSDPIIFGDTNRIYYVSYSNGTCLSYDSVVLVIIEMSTPIDSIYKNLFFIPNVITPNGDGNNDILYLQGNDIRSVQIKIYNVQGKKVFESDSKNFIWDGKIDEKKVVCGVYIYGLHIEFYDGSFIENKGNVFVFQ